MTIGIGIAGPGAGRAALAALASVEKVGRGMLGGFVSVAALDAEGRLHRAGLQRGGATALLAEGQPEAILQAPIVALMSSGPDRQLPLSQFSPAREGVGCVSGHRLPNMPGRPGGEPLTALALDRLAEGMSAQEAIASVLDAHPESDAGLIAVTVGGEVAVANSALAAVRTDACALVTEGAGLKIAILHNAIFPVVGLAALAAGAAIDAVAPADAYDFEITLSAGLALSTAPPDCVEIDDYGRIVAISGLLPGWAAPTWQGAAALRGAPVTRDGRQVGLLVSEAYCVAKDDILQSCDGQSSVRLRVRTTERDDRSMFPMGAR